MIIRIVGEEEEGAGGVVMRVVGRHATHPSLGNNDLNKHRRQEEQLRSNSERGTGWFDHIHGHSNIRM